MTPLSKNLALTLLIIVVAPSNGQELASKQDESPRTAFKALADIENFSFDRFEAKGRFGRTIRFYLSKTKSDKPLPLVVCIQGSGGQSVFVEVDTPDGKRIGSTGTETVVIRGFREKARALIVEKPGVEFCSQPKGSAEAFGEKYNREFSLERWVEAINTALNATLQMPDIDSTKVLALGHSEGGQVACELAAINPKVTHVANMAGGGPTQLFDLMQQARSGDMYDPEASAEDRVAALMKDWKAVQADPTATDKFILGHSHLRWSSFLKSSPIEAILKSKAKVYVATGTADKNSLPASAEAFYAELMARGRDCTYDRIEGADHAFMQPDERSGKGWMETNSKAIRWFLESQ